MDTTVIVALFTLAGVGLSILGSYFVTRKTLDLEAKKLRNQNLEIYSEELLKKRLEIYPKIYYCLSSFVKNIENRNVSKEILHKLNAEFSQMDSEYAIFFEPPTIDACIKFRQTLNELTDLSEEGLSRALSSPPEVESLLELLGDFEVKLKKELGVIGFEAFTPDGELRTKQANYRELLNKSSVIAGGIKPKTLPPSSRT